MIIHAADRFVCDHRWVATATAIGDDVEYLLVCDGCGHRTEQLSLTKAPSSGEVVAFQSPLAEAARTEARGSGLHKQFLLNHSA